MSYDLAAATASALHDRVDPLLRRPAHLDEVGDRDPADRRIGRHRHHRVAMAAQNEGGNVLDRDVEFLGEEMAEPGGIEHSGHSDDSAVRKAAKFAERPDHRVERIGDADDEAVGGVRLDALADRLHHLEVDPEQIVAAHPGLSGDSGGDDADVGVGDLGIILGAGQPDVIAFDRAGLGEIEALALRNALGDVDHHDVAKLLDRREMGERAADIAGADQRDLLASHAPSPAA